MKITREDQGKTNKFHKLNSVGSKIKSFNQLSFLVDEESGLLDIGEYSDVCQVFRKKCEKKNFNTSVHSSNNWIESSITSIIEDPSLLFYSDDEELVDQGKVEVLYHNFLIMEPNWEYEKDIEKIRKKESEIMEGDPLEQEKAEKRRQRSLKAAETRRRRQLENGTPKV